MSSNVDKKANASNIAKSLLNSYPSLRRFLDISLNGIKVDTKTVGKGFNYPISIIKNNLVSNYGIFMDYFIRKHLSNQFQVVLKDDSAELVLKDKDIYFTGNKQKCYDQILNHYSIFKDSKTKAMDIIESIKIVSIAYTLTFHDPLPKCSVDSEAAALKEIMKYFEGLPYKKVDMKTKVDCKYFDGCCDLIFNENILYEIKTSKYKSLSRHDAVISINNFYKLILYAFGYYKKTGIIIKTFKIYNPLLGLEYTISLDKIDMQLFENCLQKDVEILKTK